MAVMISKQELLRRISNVPGDMIYRWNILGIIEGLPAEDIDMSTVRRALHCRDCKHFNWNQANRESAYGKGCRWSYHKSCDAWGKYGTRQHPTPSMPKCCSFEPKEKTGD